MGVSMGLNAMPGQSTIRPSGVSVSNSVHTGNAEHDGSHLNDLAWASCSEYWSRPPIATVLGPWLAL
jgi:hypothetical protein